MLATVAPADHPACGPDVVLVMGRPGVLAPDRLSYDTATIFRTQYHNHWHGEVASVSTTLETLSCMSSVRLNLDQISFASRSQAH